MQTISSGAEICVDRYHILLRVVVTVACRVFVSFVTALFSLESHRDKQCLSMFRELKQPRFVIKKCVLQPQAFFVQFTGSEPIKSAPLNCRTEDWLSDDNRSQKME